MRNRCIPEHCSQCSALNNVATFVYNFSAAAPTRFGKSILGRRMEAALSQVDFEHCDPSTCVSVLRLPSRKIYTALNKKLKSCERVWMEGFLEEGGLDVLLKGVESVSMKRALQLADAMVLLECVSCVKCVMNSKTGLNVITQHKEYVQILMKGKCLKP